jgi:hypothetical protein
VRGRDKMEILNLGPEPEHLNLAPDG